MAEPGIDTAERRVEAPPQKRRAILIVNTLARSGTAAHDRAKSELEMRGFVFTATFPVQDPARLPEIVAEAAAHKPPCIVIGGGDGTISAALDALAYTDTVCGLLPLGTANSFARSLNLPLDLDAAIDVIASGRVIRADLGRINADYFASAAAIGLSAAISRRKPHLLKRLLGRAAYPAVAGIVLPGFKPFRCTMQLASGERRNWPAVLELRIANASYEGGVEAAPDADVTSGDLVVHLVTGTSKWRLLRTWGQIVAGRQPSGPGFERLRTAHFRLQTEPVHDVNIDGEAAMQTPVEVDIARAALKVLVPA